MLLTSKSPLKTDDCCDICNTVTKTIHKEETFDKNFEEMFFSTPYMAIVLACSYLQAYNNVQPDAKWLNRNILILAAL